MVNNNPINPTAQVVVEKLEGNELTVVTRQDEARNQVNVINANNPDEVEIDGIITAPADFIEKRDQCFDHLNARVEVTREDYKIELIINERGCMPALDASLMGIDNYNKHIMNDYANTTVTGTIQLSDIFGKLHINDDNYWWDPQKLSAFFRLNRSIFTNLQENMTLVAILKGIKAKINSEYEKTKDTFTGSKTDHYMMTVEHNLPKNFVVKVPIFKGQPAENYDIEFDADFIDGRLLIQLKSPAINDMIDNSRDEIINKELQRIIAIAPDLLIIEK